MPGLSTGIQMALQAVLTHSQAIEIIEHNVANASTPGYHRQSAVLAATVPTPGYGMGMDHPFGAGQMGTGVMMQRIQRYSQDILDTRYRAAAGEAQDWSARKDILVRMESVMAETTGAGLSTKLDKFWSGWQSLASDPTNLGLRTAVLDNAQTVVDAFHSRANEMNLIRTDQNQVLSNYTDEINAAASQIARLNSEISHVLSVGDQPNDMLDERDRLLNRLSELTGATSHPQENGQVIVNIGGHVLVTGTESIPLTAKVGTAPADANGLYNIYWADGQKLTPPSGAVKGILTVRDVTIPEQLDKLNQLALNFSTKINEEHIKGYVLNGAAHSPEFFTAGDALNIEITPGLTEEDIAAAGSAASPGDSSVAATIADLKNWKMAFNDSAGNPQNFSQTFGQYYNAQVTSLGVETKNAITSAGNQNNLFAALNDQRESFNGVSLDEEAANLAKYQKAYQAAARIMNVYDQLLDTIINGMGLAGR